MGASLGLAESIAAASTGEAAEMDEAETDMLAAPPASGLLYEQQSFFSAYYCPVSSSSLLFSPRTWAPCLAFGSLQAAIAGGNCGCGREGCGELQAFLGVCAWIPDLWKTKERLAMCVGMFVVHRSRLVRRSSWCGLESWEIRRRYTTYHPTTPPDFQVPIR